MALPSWWPLVARLSPLATALYRSKKSKIILTANPARPHASRLGGPAKLYPADHEQQHSQHPLGADVDSVLPPRPQAHPPLRAECGPSGGPGTSAGSAARSTGPAGPG